MIRALSVLSVSKGFKLPGGGVLHALRHVSLDVDFGEVVAVVGPNGSGKTTLLRIAAGLLEPDSGEVELLGSRLYDLEHGERSSKLKLTGYLSQEDLLIDTMDILENVELPLIVDGVDRRNRREAAISALRLLGSEGLMDRRTWELSGGERRKVSLARALVRSPRIVFLDEPTSNLDEDSVLQVAKLIRELADGGTAVLLCTHDRAIEGTADRMVELRGGEVVGG